MVYDAAAPAPLPYRFRSLEHSCSISAAPSHTCQCENKPVGMAKLPVQFMSAAIRQIASTDMNTAIGVRSAASANAN